MIEIFTNLTENKIQSFIIFFERLVVIFFLFNIGIYASDINEADINNLILNKKASNILVFKNLYIFDDLNENDRLISNLYIDSIKKKIKTYKRFNIYEKSEIAEKLLKTGVNNVNIDNKKELIDLADTVGLDGFFEPDIIRGDGKLNLSLSLLDSKGKLFAREIINDFQFQDAHNLFVTVSDLTDKLISRIPYAGLITKIVNDLIFLDVGKKDNFKQNDVVKVFKVNSVKRHPFLEFVVDVEKDNIARLVLVEVNEDNSVAKVRSIKPNTELVQNLKIGKEIVAKDPFLYPEPVKTFKRDQDTRIYKSYLGFFQVRAIASTFRHVFSSDNTDYNQTVSTILYPEMQVLGDLWLTSKWIVAMNMQFGVVPLYDNNMNPSKINASITNIGLNLKYRFLLGKTLADPSILPIIGIYRYGFTPDNATPLFLTKKTYFGFNLGFEFVVPINQKISFNSKGLVNPYVGHNESPLKSGEEDSTLGFYFDVSINYRIRDRICFVGGIKVENFNTEYSGSSERNTPNANSSISSMGFFGGLGVDF